jgi:hypothetical protein
MSKTDKTRPAWVKATDKAAYLVPVHDHRFGGCDLPERAEATRHGVYAPPKGARCHWGISAAFWASPAGRCGLSEGDVPAGPAEHQAGVAGLPGRQRFYVPLIGSGGKPRNAAKVANCAAPSRSGVRDTSSRVSPAA